ncbi:glycosyltransferase family 2 protein [Micropruina sp.]|uniref:glycosyltransferase family 2 protein n=1 Tax=Micropruina sp. TaxID=2737536 RepID=UPI00344C2BDC
MPCRDEIDALAWLLPRIPTNTEVILCDNGSTDGSPGFAASWGAKVLVDPAPRQVGRCVQSGIAAASADVVCVIDCDGTIDPRDAVRLAGPIVSGSADFVVGVRAKEETSRSVRHRLASHLRDALVRRVLPEWPFVDLGSARAFRRSAFAQSDRRPDERFGWNLDVTMCALEMLDHDRIDSLGIPYRPRIGKSKIADHFFGSLVAVTDQLRVLQRYLVRKVGGYRLAFDADADACKRCSRWAARNASPWVCSFLGEH